MARLPRPPFARHAKDGAAAVYQTRRATHLSKNAAHVREQIRAELRVHVGNAIFRAEEGVNQQAVEAMRLLLRPLHGLDFVCAPVPTATPWATVYHALRAFATRQKLQTRSFLPQCT